MRYTFTTTDEAEAAQVMAAADLCHILSELDQELREVAKHGPPPEAGETVESALQWVRDRLRAYMVDNNVDMDRLWP